ncbi:aldo/keto reductase [Corticibacter populi]|uniref:Aldo/keto reductase n=1 Tax=Corticibacter populi TaxID=1550736 RepID=A0A3M6QYA1_9BURK|nr:aldo/keto reductase [Corticibacter populi]RMX07990.1 aldo/keto reductase [Corticibacter populi]RZS35232.1 diketogulonate reductase-like aldo/keto reductase [Corticibacter populi]
MSIPLHTLNDGTTVPAIGFGTYTLNGAAGVETIIRAIHNGYRLIDSAFNYENEGAVGRAVRSCGVPREQLRVASKLPGRHQRHGEAIATIEESLYRTGLDYFDLYLIHWPNPKQGLYVEAWRALIEARQRGLVRSIGVCNFLPEHLDRLIAETGVAPSLNQIELHPHFPQLEQQQADRQRGILTQAWSPLGRASSVLQEPLLVQIAARISRSVGQVILRWEVQQGVLPIPKANSDQRQRDNLAVFDFTLSDEDMAAIAGLARTDGRINDQDPAVYEEF